MSDEPNLEVATEEPKLPVSNELPVKKTTDWEASYKGLQRNYERLQKQYNELQSKYDDVIEDLEATKQSHKSVITEKDEMMKTNVDLTSQLSSLQEKESNRTLERDRYMLILSEFSDLAEFEANGLLPQGANTDELRTKFTSFREALAKTGTQKVQDVLKGAGPGPVTNQAESKRSKEQVYMELLGLAGKQDKESREKYELLMSEWVKLN